MYWLSAPLLLLLSSALWAAEGYLLGGGVELDSDDALATSVFAELGIGENTWLSGTLAYSSLDLPRAGDSDTLYADIAIDHWFDPVGLQASVAYWGDSEVLDSVDWQGSLYWRNDKVRLSADYEYRDFTFDVFRDTALPGQDVEFSANGIGLSARVGIGESVSLRLSGMDYDYSVNLGRAANQPIRDFLSVSRLSMINSLIDYRAGIGLGLDVGERHWSLDYATWKAEVDGSKVDSTTLRFLTPLSSRSDIEFGIGIDDSDVYGSVTLFSVSIYFYG